MQKMTKLLLIILTTISITAATQSTDCSCFNGIGSTEKDEPSLTIEFSNGTVLTVCGYEQEKINENEVLISEFNVFNCKSGVSLVEYGAIQNCLVKKNKLGLQISELKFLPSGDNWKWKQVEIGIQQIFIKENQLVISDQKPAYAQAEISQTKVDSFLEGLREMKGTGKLDNPEEILGKLEILALNKVKEAGTILYDFEDYFKYQTDGAIAEQWKDAIATVKRIKG